MGKAEKHIFCKDPPSKISLLFLHILQYFLQLYLQPSEQRETEAVIHPCPLQSNQSPSGRKKINNIETILPCRKWESLVHHFSSWLVCLLLCDFSFQG